MKKSTSSVYVDDNDDEHAHLLNGNLSRLSNIFHEYHRPLRNALSDPPYRILNWSIKQSLVLLD